MAMSWGFTPLCRFGNDRYRLSNNTSERTQSSGPIPTTQCGIIPARQLPPDTSISVSNTTENSVSTPLRPKSPPRVQVSSASLSGSESSSVQSVQSVTSNPEDRVVRRSPRLAQATRVTYRDDSDSHGNKRRNHWGTRVQEMWNNERSQNNTGQQSNPNYSVYNYDGQVTPCVNATSSVPVLYNRNIFSSVSLLRYPHNVPFTNKSPSYPVNNVKTVPKNVTIKSLDFYEIRTTLVQQEIIPEGMRAFQDTYSFVLKADDARNLLDKKKKHPYLIQLRFCKLDGSCEQNDYYPTSHQISVNHRFIMLPGLETLPRGAMKPMDITRFCQLNSQAINLITIRCFESCKMYVYIVQKFTSDDLLIRLELKPHLKEDETVTEIKKKLQDDQADDGIAAATLQFSLLCPLSRLRIKLPCRASTCTHLQCFDAATYLKLNECKPKWSCPVCYQPALYKNLLIDGYFKKIIDQNIEADKIELQPDGTWTLVDAKKKAAIMEEKVPEKSKKEKSEDDPADKTVTLDSDDDDTPVEGPPRQENGAIPSAQVAVPRQSNSPEVVTLSDDDSSDGDNPEVTASTFPTFENPPASIIPSNDQSSRVTIPNDLSYLNNLWQGALGTINTQQFNDTYGNFGLDRSNQLYIPLTRTPIPAHLSSGLTVNCRNIDNDIRSSSNKDTQRSRSAVKAIKLASKSKKKKNQKVPQKNAKKNLSDVVVKRKRRRILSASSDSSDSNSDSRKKKTKPAIKASIKKKPNHKKINSDSSEELSSSPTSTSKSSGRSVNLISSSDGSGSDSGSGSSSCSSSSESSDNESENSDDSFTVKDVNDSVEESSRVLRSALRRHARKK